MAHLRKRFLINKLEATAGFSPLVGVIGHRQVGKTTLLSSEAGAYYTFDDHTTLMEAKTSASDFLKNRKGKRVALDECQLVDELFPALKEHVRKNPWPGQYFLSGSVKFTSKKSIKESLTGRIVTLELLPLLISELYEKPLATFWTKTILKQKFNADSLRLISKEITDGQVQKYFDSGGLPGVCFIRNKVQMVQRLNSYIETILDRDVRQVSPTTLAFPQMLVLLQYLAKEQGVPINLSQMSRETSVGIPTIKKLLYAFESVFLIRNMPLQGDLKGPVYFFEDMLERINLKGGGGTDFENISHFALNHIRGELSYGSLDQPYSFFQYRTRAGVVVPVCVSIGEKVLGVIPIESDLPSRSESAAGDSFLRQYGGAKIVFLGMKSKAKILDDRRAVFSVASTV